jgi:MFS family permease
MDVEGNGNGNGATPHPGAFDVSPARRTVLLGVFSLAIALDIVNVSALLTTTETIANDLGLVAGNVTWIITAYSMTFASFMLFAGRLADLFPAQWLFEGGLFLLGILMIVLSFIRNKYAFLVIRALQGICGAMTVPSA